MSAAEGDRWREKWHVGLAWGGIYLVVALSVLLVELDSEHDKLDRGVYSDTFDAMSFVRLATLPAAFLVPSTAQNDRAALNDAALHLGAAALVQAIAVGLVAVTLSWLSARENRALPKR
jgi:hypothetical protein